MKYSCAIHRVGKQAKKGEKFCLSNHRGSLLFCTRAEGHKGDHVAHGVGGKPLKRWRNPWKKKN